MLHRALLLLLIVCCQACTSEFVIKTVYNSMDDSFAGYVNDYARFDKDQKAIIDQTASNLAEWHRRTHLSQFGDIIKQADELLDAPVQQADMMLLGNKMEVLGQELSAQPWDDLMPLLATLQEQQIQQIDEKLAEEIIEVQEQLDEREQQRTEEQPNAEELKGVKKMFKRVFAVKLTQQQLAIVSQGMDQSIRLEAQSVSLRKNWNAEFIALLRGDTSVDEGREIRNHMLAAGRRLRDRYPSEIETNKQVISASITDVLNSFSEKQRQAMQARLRKYYGIIQELVNQA